MSKAVFKDRKSKHNRQTSLRELAILFLKLGTTAFGGPAAHIAMMREEVVTRRNWLTESEFLDYLGATNLIPGPNSTEMAIHVGHYRRGWAGLLVAGAAFILPAVVIVWAIASAYVQYGSLPEVSNVLYGIKPVLMGIVIQALWSLGRTAVKSFFLSLVGVVSFGASAAGVNEVAILVAAGTAAMAVLKWRIQRRSAFAGLGVGAIIPVAISRALAAAALVKVPLSLTQLFFIFLKIGGILFGSGYVLLAFLRNDLVERLHWLTENQLLDAIVVGQFTPGPVFTTATFIGYVLAGNHGAILATLGIFLPAFFFVAISAPLVPKLRKSAIAGAFLDGVNVASLALMALVTWQLGQVTFVDAPTVFIGLIAAVVLIRFRVNSAWLVLVGGLVGYLNMVLFRAA